MHNLNLKAYLANVGMTMTDFCQKIDCDRAYLSTISTGKVLPGRRLARDIYNATNGVINLPTKTKKSDKSDKCA
jgi:DNA-binding XRE family transcriptional regulator